MQETTKGLQGTQMDALLKESSVDRRLRVNGMGLALVGVTGGAAVALSIIAAPFVTPALRKVCLPYVPATSRQVRNVVTGLKGRSGRLVDLGSGDGRIVVAAARHAQLKAVGVELNPWLVWYSRWAAWRGGVASSTSFVTQDLWRLDLRDYQNIVIFGVEEMVSAKEVASWVDGSMPDLESKLSQELTQDSLVIACRFPLPSWKPTATIGHGLDSVWLYHRPLKATLQTVEAPELLTSESNKAR
ncbi:Protein FAM173B [Portunus trituberculatus]|uniref:Protein FAM173B n=1 Tax=Portunus trituberculatus TaxID=210409 RepID=A0A5B7CRU2_PORTR|nr:Protein FAM173B [Portunus trituberculatus]